MTVFFVFTTVVFFATTGLLGLMWIATQEDLSAARQAAAAAQEAAGKRVSQANDELAKCRSGHATFRAAAENKVRELMQKDKRTREENARLQRGMADLQQTIASLRSQLARWQKAVDVEAEAARVLAEANAEAERLVAVARAEAARIVADADSNALALRRQMESDLDDARRRSAEILRRGEDGLAEAQQRAKTLRLEADALLAAAVDKASLTIAKAEAEARKIAGDAYELKSQVSEMEKRLKAIRNHIDGYGDEYIVPAQSLLDELADEVSYKDAGQNLKAAREVSRAMVRSGQAAVCEYVEENRRKTAVDFVVDAFNGKVDSALSRVKNDNAGKLSQEIFDAFTLVNANGEAFRNARITTEYLNARLAELKWAAIAQEIKRQEAEEQRQIRERLREEEKARREYQRAIKEAAKEEEAVQKAMARLSEQMAKATESQRAAYEQQLSELQGRLKEAEERGQRAMSMAQLTKSGHVYIISNVGSFGEHVYKIGLTRRLDPLDRVRELGDSSVPFAFDVHALIKSDDAPALEHRLHRHFLIHQVNKVNHRKEFFRVNLRTIRAEVESLGLESQWTMAAEAAQYRESLAIERRIAEDPVAREQWLMRQIQLEMVEEKNQVDDEGALAGVSDEEDE